MAGPPQVWRDLLAPEFPSLLIQIRELQTLPLLPAPPNRHFPRSHTWERLVSVFLRLGEGDQVQVESSESGRGPWPQRSSSGRTYPAWKEQGEGCLGTASVHAPPAWGNPSRQPSFA